MIHKHILIGGLVAALLLGIVTAFPMAAPDFSRPLQDGQNLLKNPGFEGVSCSAGSSPGWCDGNWTRDTFNGVTYSEIFSPQEWVTFWSEGTNPADGRNYGRPECKIIPNKPPFVGPPARIHSDNYAIMQFGFFRSIDSGVYQVVTGLSPHATVQFSSYAQAWSCDNDESGAYSCGDVHNIAFRVGIDPNGGTDPWNPNIVWGSGFSNDEFRMIGPVQAQVGDAGNVTVFLRATATWAYKHNDVYWDTASLVYTTPPEPPTNTPPPPPDTPTPGPSPTPGSTATPRPDGATVHIVAQNDTLFGIALMHGVDVNQLRELNAGSLGPNDMLSIGQTVVISLPSETPVPTPLPAPEPTATLSNPTTEGQPGGASICVLAYHDRNGDTFRDESTEELLPNAEIAVADVSGVIARYTTDGISEPYCFTGLAAGAYRVIQSPPPGYEPSGPAEWPVAVAEGTSLDLHFADVRGEGATTPGEADEPTPTSARGGDGGDNESTSSSTFGAIIGTAMKIGGVLVLILALGVAVLFVLTRRRR